MIFNFFILVLLLSFDTVLHAHNLVPKKLVTKMTTSVVIPCVARHFFWLSGVLEAYQTQTVLPDEIVISLSEVEKLDPAQIDRLEKGLWGFKLKVLKNNGVVVDGNNRTLAMNQATGDILIFSDADDLPHPQRVEVAKYFFENFELDHIIHGLGYDRVIMKHFDIESLPVLQFGGFNQFISHVEAYNIHTTLGSPCFLRKIGDRIKWAATNDREYNMAVYNNTVDSSLKF